MGFHWYDNGTIVNLTATPAAGWEFKEWEGDVASKESAKTTVLMDKDQKVRARFSQIFLKVKSRYISLYK